MLCKVVKHQVGKYMRSDGKFVDAFVCGTESGYVDVVPVVVYDGKQLTHVELTRTAKGRPLVKQAMRGETEWSLVRVNCLDTLGMQNAPVKGYGTIYVSKGMESFVKIVAIGHSRNGIAKQNDVLLMVKDGAEIIVRSINSGFKTAKLIKYCNDPMFVTVGKIPNVTRNQLVDILNKEVVEDFKF